MEAATPLLPKPAQLMRRINRAMDANSATIGRDPAAPMLRFQVEVTRGSLLVTLAPGDHESGAVQWTQNGVPLRGQTGPSLHLAGLTFDDGDVYYALIGAGAERTRSQSFLVVVVPGNPLLNHSARGYVTAAKPLILGFVVGRAVGPIKPKRYLIRVIGPSLRRFGITDTIVRPAVVLHRGQAKLRDLARSEEHAEFVREWQPKLGAFALEPDTSEIVCVVELESGPYSLVVTGNEAEQGEALIEIYEIPA
jgi:hypothetical protein